MLCKHDNLPHPNDKVSVFTCLHLWPLRLILVKMGLQAPELLKRLNETPNMALPNSKAGALRPAMGPPATSDYLGGPLFPSLFPGQGPLPCAGWGPGPLTPKGKWTWTLVGVSRGWKLSPGRRCSQRHARGLPCRCWFSLGRESHSRNVYRTRVLLWGARETGPFSKMLAVHSGATQRRTCCSWE